MVALKTSSPPDSKSPGRIPKLDPPWGSIIYTVGALESRIGDSSFQFLPGLWVVPRKSSHESPKSFTTHRFGLVEAANLHAVGKAIWLLL